MASCGIKDAFDNVVRRHFGKYLAECGIAVSSDVFFDVFRVDNAAVTKSNTLLLLVEACFTESNRFVIFLVNSRVVVNESFDNAAL